jgi:hypothetical protein
MPFFCFAILFCAITHLLLFFLKQQEARESFRFFIGLEDGDKQTVFLNRTDWFQRTGWFFWNRIINGLSLGFFPDTFGWVFHRDFPKKEEVD